MFEKITSTTKVNMNELIEKIRNKKTEAGLIGKLINEKKLSMEDAGLLFYEYEKIREKTIEEQLGINTIEPILKSLEYAEKQEKIKMINLIMNMIIKKKT